MILADITKDNLWNATIWGMPLWASIIVICIFLFISGMYSAGENAFSNCNKYHFQSLANKGNRTAKLITYLVDQFDNTLVTILVGNNIIQTLMSFLSAMIFYDICQATGLGNYEAILSTIIMGVLVYLVSDTCPKILSKAIPNRMAILLSYPVFITQIILYPVIFLFKCVLKLVYKLFKIKDENLLTKEDLLHSVNVAINDETILEDAPKKEKLFENDEKVIVNNIFNFDKLLVEKVYTPKEKVFSLDINNLTCESLNKALKDISYSRIPIYDGEKDKIIGILVLKIYFEEYVKDKHLNIRSILEDPIFIDSKEEIDDAFDMMNKEKVHLGIVVTNHKYVGIITMQDVLEELVDDIDETNKETK